MLVQNEQRGISMKYLVATICIALAVALCAPSVAMATNLESQIESNAQQHPNVEKARCVVYNNCCLLCIKPQKISTKSNFDQMKQELQQQICQLQNFSIVVVSMSPRVMQAIDSTDGMDESQKQQFVQDLLQRALEHLSTHPLPHKFAK